MEALTFQKEKKSKSHKSKKRKYKKTGKHKKDKKYKSSSSSESTNDEWVEKEENNKHTHENVQDKHDKLMLFTDLIPTVSKSKMQKEKKERKQNNMYDPTKNSKELNPYWKDGGNGLPSMSQNIIFKKPYNEVTYTETSTSYNEMFKKTLNKQSNMNLICNKMCFESNKNDQTPSNNKYNDSNADIDQNMTFTEKDINEIAAKILKAEILGNMSLADELKKKLEFARKSVKQNSQLIKEKKMVDEVILTDTDMKGYTRPCLQLFHDEQPSCSKRKEKVETHAQGKRIKYFADDDEYSLNKMFEKEKFSSSYDQNLEFVKMSKNLKNTDDVDDVFIDSIRNKMSDEKLNEKNKNKSIIQLNKITKSVDNCYFCIDSPKSLKHLIIAVGENVYIALPSYKSLMAGHCFIVPIKHISCSTQVDEDVWDEIQNFRLALVKMFSVYNFKTLFFEHVFNLQNFPHMIIQCIPLPKNIGEMAPIYFKKSILECETEWTMNKKLIDLKGSNVRRKIPKGLPYFFVEFGMENGFGHIIEEQKNFPINFAQEIIGGMLDLPHHLWRKPSKDSYSDQRQKVKDFLKMWNDFDITKNKT